jgi:hypothetical protein
LKAIKYILAILLSIAVAACGGGGSDSGNGNGNGNGNKFTSPGAPTTVTASPGDKSATVSFTAPANNGGTAITGYAVTSSPGNITATGTASPISVTNLVNGTLYTFTVVATNSAGNSAASTASNSVTPSATPIVPDAPTAVTATAGNTTATVTFIAPASNGGAAITGYTVTSSPAGGTDSNAATSGLTHTITGLTNGTAYTFTVVATNSAGSSAASTASNSVTPSVVITVPGVPTAVTATAGNASATVSFTAPASDGGAAISGYTVTSSPAGGTDSNAGTTGLTHTITGLSNGTAYTFTVVATNSKGNSPVSSASNSVTPVTVPSVPTSVTATAGNTTATVTFIASANNGGAAITGYTVTSNPAGGTDSNAGSTGLTHTITGLTNGTAYTFTVVAANSAGSSAASTASNSVTPNVATTVPGVPTAVTAAAGNASATVSFTAPVSDGGAAITGYTVTSNPGNFTATGTASPISVAGLINGTAYTFTVVATNSKGNSPASSASNSVMPAVTPVSGTVTGPWVEGVTITAVAAAGGTFTAITDATGNYNNLHLSSGSYTLTASLPGYTFSPVNIPVTVPAGSSAAITGNNFAATSAFPSYSISGTVNYSGSQTGAVSVLVYYSTGVGPNYYSPAGTVISGPGAYTVRGLQNGSYVVVAERDGLHNGAPNASNPLGWTTFSISGADVTGKIVTMTDPAAPAPVTPTINAVFPAANGAFINHSTPKDSLGQEIATSYKLYWGTDTNASTGGGNTTIPAHGDNQPFAILSGLTNGATYFKITAMVGGTESVPSAVFGPVTIGTSTAGTNTVSGNVTYTGTTGVPMLVGLYSSNGVYFSRIASASNNQAFSIAGVPNGDYYNFAIVDMNNNGIVDIGDISNVNGGNNSNIIVSGNRTHDIVLSSANATALANTIHQNNGTDYFQVKLGTDDGIKHVVAVTITSGPNIAVPLDLSLKAGNSYWAWLNGATPLVGDTYKYTVTYSDGSTGNRNLTASVTGLNNSFAQSMAATSSLTPTFSWAAPASAPASYSYQVNIDSMGWYTDYLPSAITSVPYGGSPLTAATPYTWQVHVIDGNGNEAIKTGTFTTP